MNNLEIDWTPKQYNSVVVEISEVQLLREFIKPVISISPLVIGPTNNRAYSIIIDDASRVKTFFYVNEAPNQVAQKQFGFLISKEGLNVVRGEATDSFGNKSQFYTVQSHVFGPGQSHLIGPPKKNTILVSFLCQNLSVKFDLSCDNFHLQKYKYLLFQTFDLLRHLLTLDH